MVDNSVFKLIPKKLITNVSNIDINEILSKDIICIYFSASWCPPCKLFTPLLKSVYEEWKQQHNSIEIIFASSDRNSYEFSQYFKTMPWTAIKFEDKSQSQNLQQYLKKNGIPSLVVFDKTGKILDNEGTQTVKKYSSGAFGVWKSN